MNKFFLFLTMIVALAACKDEEQSAKNGSEEQVSFFSGSGYWTNWEWSMQNGKQNEG